MNAKQSYVLNKKYTDDSIIGLGSIKGANCTIKSVTKRDGITTVVFEWLANDNVTKETTSIQVADGTPIYTWEPNDDYEYGDLVIYESCFYRCIVPNHDSTFDDTHWNEIGSPDGNYDIVEKASDLPVRFTPADRKMYYVIDEQSFYLWNGTEWVSQTSVISNDDIDALFGF